VGKSVIDVSGMCNARVYGNMPDEVQGRSIGRLAMGMPFPEDKSIVRQSCQWWACHCCTLQPQWWSLFCGACVHVLCFERTLMRDHYVQDCYALDTEVP
jgi:hypothetical protein